MSSLLTCDSSADTSPVIGLLHSSLLQHITRGIFLYTIVRKIWLIKNYVLEHITTHSYICLCVARLGNSRKKISCHIPRVWRNWNVNLSRSIFLSYLLSTDKSLKYFTVIIYLRTFAIWNRDRYICIILATLLMVCLLSSLRRAALSHSCRSPYFRLCCLLVQSLWCYRLLRASRIVTIPYITKCIKFWSQSSGK